MGAEGGATRPNLDRAPGNPVLWVDPPERHDVAAKILLLDNNLRLLTLLSERLTAQVVTSKMAFGGTLQDYDGKKEAGVSGLRRTLAGRRLRQTSAAHPTTRRFELNLKPSNSI